VEQLDGRVARSLARCRVLSRGCLYRVCAAMRKFAQKTQHDYVQRVKEFASYLKHSPDTVTLDRPDLGRHLSNVHRPSQGSDGLKPRRGCAFSGAAPGIKYKAALSVAYGAGLRVSEVAALKVSDIDSKRMMLRVEQGKGRKDRYAMLSPTLLELLRDWHRIEQPQGWLFPGLDPTNPITTRQLTRACHTAASMANIKKRVTPLAGIRLQPICLNRT